MKRIVLPLTAVCLLAVIGLYVAQRRSQPASNRTASADVSQALDNTSSDPAARPASRASASNAEAAKADESGANPRPASHPAVSAAAPAASTSVSLPYQQALSTLISVQAGFDQKQAAWKQLRETGRLDHVITDLEQRAAADPAAAEYPAVLGQAYLQKAGTLSDIREQGILGMKADQSFDAALSLDSSNWEAGFWKAAALSYWPPQLGKGKEVIERFVALVKLQENQPAQPQFAQTYVMLGDQYQKQGYADYAKQTWQRGATLFPNDATLGQKLSQPAPEQAFAR